MMRITRNVLESYMACHYKAYLKLAGHDYPPAHERKLQPPGASQDGLTPSDRVLPPLVGSQAHKSTYLTPKILSAGLPNISDALYETALISLHFDGLQRVPGLSDLGGFHYVPILLHSGGGVHEIHKCLLDIYGFVLSQLQGRLPEKGIVWRDEGKSSTLSLSQGLKKGERILNALLAMQSNTQRPTLILNGHCQICEFQSRCYAQAAEEDNLSLLRGISDLEIIRLNRKGIFTVNQLSYTFRPRQIKKRARNPARPRYFALQARAIREQKIFVHGAPKLNLKETRIYLDFEGGPASRSYYLIGLLISQPGAVEQRSFWANEEDGEAQIFLDMLDHIKQYRDFSVLHFGAYEIRALRHMQRKLPTEYASQIENILQRAVNVLSIIGPHIYFPVFSNGLKDIAGHLGHKWSAANASGRQSLLWRHEWNETRDELTKQQLIRYNMEDCLALKLVSEFIEQVVHQQAAAPHTHVGFLHTDHFEKPAGQRGKFQKQDFTLEEFDFINRCSYFDYQRDRMSARSKRRLEHHAPKRSRAPKVHKNNKVLEVSASRCPNCRSRKFSFERPLKRQIIDLKFSGAAVRRWVVLYLSKEYHCGKCNKNFIPDGFPKIRTKFGKGLVSWCMYQMVVGGQNMSRIRAGVSKLFGLDIDVSTVYGFKQAMSLHYQQSYRKVLEDLMGGPVLYIDETAANLRSETGYVWCITDGHSAYYFYRSSREGSFLGDMLKDFRGVLVSDFYTAYDSLGCRQQRCLVHLMRDFNEEMQKQPFDNELKILATKFSAVLNSAVKTVDAHGFRTRYLKKHKEAAQEFCQWASSKEFSSSAAERLRLRIEKYRDRLFTFLDCDGVSWNNTNAEHFIKPFAKYRRTANGVFTARSIQDYLVILTMAETCKGRGGDFLDFLLEDNELRFSFMPGRHAPKKEANMNAALATPSGPG